MNQLTANVFVELGQRGSNRRAGRFTGTDRPPRS